MNKKEALDRLFGEMYSSKVGGTASDSSITEVKELYNENITGGLTNTTPLSHDLSDFSEVESEIKNKEKLPPAVEEYILQDEKLTDRGIQVIKDEIEKTVESVIDSSPEDKVFTESKEEQLETAFINNIVEETKVGKNNFDELIEDQQIELGFKQSYDETSSEEKTTQNITENEEPEFEEQEKEDTIEFSTEQNYNISEEDIINHLPQKEETTRDFIKDEPLAEQETTETEGINHVNNEDAILNDLLPEEVKEQIEQQEVYRAEELNNIDGDVDKVEGEESSLTDKEQQRLQRTNTALNVAIGVLSALALFLSYKTFI